MRLCLRTAAPSSRPARTSVAYDFYGVNFEIATDVPEPSTWALLLIGLAGLAFVAYRRGQKGIRVQPFGSNGVVA